MRRRLRSTVPVDGNGFVCLNGYGHMPGLNNKVVLITGASSGIGEGTARQLASNGVRVVLGARRTERLQAIDSILERTAKYPPRPADACLQL